VGRSLREGFFIIDEEDALGARGYPVVTDCIDDRLFGNSRKVDGKGGAFSRFARHRNVAPVLLHDTVDHVEAEARALPRLLGGKEGIEYLIFDMCRDAYASVSDGELHVEARLDAVRVCL